VRPPYTNRGVTTKTRRYKIMNHYTLNRIMADYVTLTTFDSDRVDDIVSEMELSQGVASSHWTKKRIPRYNGGTISGVFVGRGTQKGKEHFIIQSSGARADTLIKLPEIKGVSNCTRIDIQMTIECANVDFLMQSHLKNTDWTTIINSPSGATYYLGSRQSMRYWRIYQKESNDGTKLLRFEVELKGAVGHAAWQLVREDTHAICGIFQSEIERVSARLRGDDMDQILDIVRSFAAQQVVKPASIKLKRAESSTMDWLETTVTSAIRKAANDHDLSYDMYRWYQNVTEILLNSGIDI